MAWGNTTTKHLYFVTTTVVNWIDVFTRPKYKQIILDSLAFCQQTKGLEIYAWVLMPNHLHMIVGVAETMAADKTTEADCKSAETGKQCPRDDASFMASIMRDFKKFTSKKILEALLNDTQESRRGWMLRLFAEASESRRIANPAKHEGCRIANPPTQDHYRFWQEGYYSETICTEKFFRQKLDYIHNNPVKAEIVDKREYYPFSSARDYMGEKGLLDVIVIR